MEQQLALFLNLLIDGISTGCLYALIAIGFSLLWWLADIVHLAHGGVIIAAGYAGHVLISRFAAPLWAACGVALVIAVVLGLSIQRGAYQKLRSQGTGEMGMLTASLGVLICMEYGLAIAFGPEGIQLDAGSARTPLLAGSGLVVDAYTVAVIATTAATFIALIVLMRVTQFGKNMRAVAENHDLANVVGIRVNRVVLGASMLASAARLLLT